jgi:G3E family GTPase
LNSHLPVTLLTGFLGSGKTTLLNRLLCDLQRPAVLINEFGATPLDQALIQQRNIPLMTLSGGCLCCQVKDSLIPILKNIYMAWQRAENPAFDQLIIECSGVVSPESVLRILLHERWLSSRYRVRTVITTVAIPWAMEQLQCFAEVRSQLNWADTVVLTQGDLASPDQQAELQTHLQAHYPAVPHLEAIQGDVDVKTLLNPLVLFRSMPSGPDPADHPFRSVSLQIGPNLSLASLQAALTAILARFGTGIVRMKGIVPDTDTQTDWVIQAVHGHLYPPTRLPRHVGSPRVGLLVIITAGNAQPLADALMALLGNQLTPTVLRVH